MKNLSPEGGIFLKLDPLLQEEWHAKYVPMIMDTVDDEKYYHPWFYFGLSKAF